MKIIEWFIVPLFLIILTGCGGGGVGNSNITPIAKMNVTPTKAIYGTTISFDGSNSFDSDGNIESYIWKEGNNILYKGVDFTKDDFTFGTHSITLIVTDDEGAIDTNSIEIVIKATVALKKTGQTSCYDDRNASKTIDCNDEHALKDDGFYQQGVESIYTRDDDTQVVTDHITGLQWQDDNSTMIIKKQWLTKKNYDICDNNLSSPACYDTSGDTAMSYCNNLLLDGGGWKLPTIDELMYIADRSEVNQSISSTFQNVVSAHYWTSSTIVAHKNGAWSVSFEKGNDRWRHKYNSLSDSNYIRCVRAEN